MSLRPARLCVEFRDRRPRAWAELPPSGGMTGEMMRARSDERALVSAGILPPTRRVGSFWEARDWAWRAGFRGVELYSAAAAALILRREHGEGNVTAAMVRARVREPV